MKMAGNSQKEVIQQNIIHSNILVGSEEYCAVELIEKSSNPFDGTKIDVFSFGVVLFAMVTATFPYDVKKRRAAIRGGLPLPEIKFPFAVSNQCKDLIKQMLEKNPEKRITIAQIIEHPWVSQL
jgi:serine/threonine protein kinase